MTLDLRVSLSADLPVVDETLDEVDHTGLVAREEDVLGHLLSTGQPHWSGAARLNNVG